MKKSTVLAAFAVAAVLGTAGAAWAVPEVSAVTMTQRANSRIVDIGYDLAGEEAIVTLSIETNGVAIPDSAVTRLSGDVSTVVQTGTGKSIVWNAGADWPEHSVTNAKARVTAWQTNSPPQYCAVDLTGGKDAGVYPVSYYPSADALPYGITNVIYKNSFLVMSKMPNGAFNMGDGTCWVILTNDFYAGVFEVTQGQWAQVMGDTLHAFYTDVSSKSYRPMELVSYEDIRGSNLGEEWPNSNAVDVNSFIWKLRDKTDLAGFDLPTEAQWEYACRAGTTSYYNDGLGGSPNMTSNDQMNVLGRYAWNGGKIDGTGIPGSSCGPENGTAIVGTYLPNAWGLYDMHGNVYEWCLDWTGTLSAGKDPSGAISGSLRVRRGGCWSDLASNCVSAYRTTYTPSVRHRFIGFRLVRTLP